MSEPTKEALELAERIDRTCIVENYYENETSRFDSAAAATLIDAHTASLREAYREELRAAREALEKANRWILQQRDRVGGDHACNECYPNSASIMLGFVCAVHAAHATCKGGKSP